jgi:gliding motility-associated-like protein
MLAWMLITLQGKAQDEKPVLKNATVFNDHGHVRLTWESQGDTLIISRDNYTIAAFEGIDTIWNTSLRSWIDETSGANTKTRSYKLSILTPSQISAESNYFNTTHMRLSMDTCKKNIQILWTRHMESSGFRNFNDTITMAEYRIWRSTDRQTFEHIATVTDDTSYTDTNIEYDRLYKYYVEGVVASDTTIKSRSNRDSINTDMPDNPGYIHFESLDTREEKTHLQFNISEDSQLRRYVLLRATDLEGPYDTLETYNTDEYALSYNDEKGNPREEIHYYHLAAINQCGALTTRSDTLSNLRLMVKEENITGLLGWNQWNHLSGNPIRFHIYRKIGDEPDFSFLQTTYNPPYRDTQIERFRGRNVSNEFCYTITADIESNGMTMQVKSNEACIYIEPSIFVPNAFTPNDDGTNDAFKPEFTFIPENYLFIVYNRSGMKVFETRDAQTPWMGRIRGGSKAPSGTYTWYLEVSGPGRMMIQKRGEVTLIYP